MFKSLRDGHKVAAIAWKWTGYTGVDPGDKGQIFKVAVAAVEAEGLAPEDAWLQTLVHWMNGMPWPDSQLMVARALTRFLNEFEGKVPLPAATIVGSRMAAQYIQDEADRQQAEKDDFEDRQALLSEFDEVWDAAWEAYDVGDINGDDLKGSLRDYFMQQQSELTRRKKT